MAPSTKCAVRHTRRPQNRFKRFCVRRHGRQSPFIPLRVVFEPRRGSNLPHHRCSQIPQNPLSEIKIGLNLIFTAQARPRRALARQGEGGTIHFISPRVVFWARKGYQNLSQNRANFAPISIPLLDQKLHVAPALVAQEGAFRRLIWSGGPPQGAAVGQSRTLPQPNDQIWPKNDQNWSNLTKS